jgi:hypothetical protein
LSELGPPQRQLRALLWKNGVEEYAEMGRNAQELLRLLEDQLVKEGLLVKEDGHE